MSHLEIYVTFRKVTLILENTITLTMSHMDRNVTYTCSEYNIIYVTLRNSKECDVYKNVTLGMLGQAWDMSRLVMIRSVTLGDIRHVQEGHTYT